MITTAIIAISFLAFVSLLAWSIIGLLSRYIPDDEKRRDILMYGVATPLLLTLFNFTYVVSAEGEAPLLLSFPATFAIYYAGAISASSGMLGFRLKCPKCRMELQCLGCRDKKETKENE